MIITLNFPVLIALGAVFWELWYLNEEMLVVASVILFLTLLVQSVGSVIQSSLDQQALDIEAKVQVLEDQYELVLKQVTAVQREAEQLGPIVTRILAFKALAFDKLEENDDRFSSSIYFEYLVWLNSIHASLETEILNTELANSLQVVDDTMKTMSEENQYREVNIEELASAALMSITNSKEITVVSEEERKKNQEWLKPFLLLRLEYDPQFQAYRRLLYYIVSGDEDDSWFR